MTRQTKNRQSAGTAVSYDDSRGQRTGTAVAGTDGPAVNGGANICLRRPPAATAGASATMQTEADIDLDLLRRAGAGDRAALGGLYDRHAAGMLGLARYLLADDCAAEDLVHDVFLEAWQRAESFDPARGTVRGWLMLRVRSRGLDRLRTTKMIRDHAQRSAASGEEPRDDLSMEIMTDGLQLGGCLDTLPEAQRQVLCLSYFCGLSCQEIAARTGTPLGTVKSRLGGAVEGLRRRLHVAGVEPP